MTRMSFTVAVAALVLALSPGIALADQYLGTYQARLSWKDHEASDGYVLDTAAQVVRQDRANVHRSIHTDEEDEGDSWFATNAKRARFEQLLNRKSAMNASTRKRILESEPLVQVEVWRDSVKVTIVD